jgi:hypothetical protein
MHMEPERGWKTNKECRMGSEQPRAFPLISEAGGVQQNVIKSSKSLFLLSLESLTY